MPQETEVHFGVTVSLPVNYENIDMIFDLFSTDNILTYLSGLCEDSDEVQIIMSMDDYEEIVSLENEDEFKEKCKEFNIKENLVFNFMFICATSFATNMRYRRNPLVFHNNDWTPATLIDRINKGVEIFRKYGVPEELIKIGNTMSDD
jgi:hypothetical protein